jgi:hypothetical protein
MEETKKPAKLRIALLNLSHMSAVYLHPALLASTLYDSLGSKQPQSQHSDNCYALLPKVIA